MKPFTVGTVPSGLDNNAIPGEFGTYIGREKRTENGQNKNGSADFSTPFSPLEIPSDNFFKK